MRTHTPKARRKHEPSSMSCEPSATVQLWTNCSRFSRKSQRLIRVCRKYTGQKCRSSNLSADLAKKHESEKYSQSRARQNRISGCCRILTRPSPSSATITNQGEDVDQFVTRSASLQDTYENKDHSNNWNVSALAVGGCAREDDDSVRAFSKHHSCAGRNRARAFATRQRLV